MAELERFRDKTRFGLRQISLGHKLHNFWMGDIFLPARKSVQGLVIPLADDDLTVRVTLLQFSLPWAITAIIASRALKCKGNKSENS